MLDMARRDILPAVTRYSRSLADTALAKQALSSEIDCSMERHMVARLSRLTGCLYRKIEALELAVLGAKNCQNVTDEACYCLLYTSEIWALGGDPPVAFARMAAAAQVASQSQ